MKTKSVERTSEVSQSVSERKERDGRVLRENAAQKLDSSALTARQTDTFQVTLLILLMSNPEEQRELHPFTKRLPARDLCDEEMLTWRFYLHTAVSSWCRAFCSCKSVIPRKKSSIANRGLILGFWRIWDILNFIALFG